MKKSPIVATLLAAFCLAVACTKSSNDTNGEVIVDPPKYGDSSSCLLAKVVYSRDEHLPYFTDPVNLTYDAQGRITSRTSYSFLATYTYEPGKIVRRTYVNTAIAIDSLMVGKEVYTLDANSRVTASTEAWYLFPKSEEDYSRKDSMTYAYNDAGYLTSKKVLAYGNYLSEELIYAYADSNCVQKEHIYYNYWSTGQSVRYGADTIKYTYDTTAWYPEARYLYEVSLTSTSVGEIQIGRNNKNNVKSIQLKMYDASTDQSANHFKAIAYTYSLTGAKPVKVAVKSTNTKGNEMNTEINFSYQCDQVTK
jgi:hypothetical protein